MKRIEHETIDGIEHKFCKNCEQYLILDNFHNAKKEWDGKVHKCKECCKLKSKKWYDANLDKQKEYRKKTKEKRKEYHKEYYNNDENLKRRKEYMREYQQSNSEYYKNYLKEWNSNNPEAWKEWYVENKKENDKYRRKYHKELYANNPKYRLRHNICTYINMSLKDKKERNTLEYLGCSIEDYILYLESKFTPEMNWDNYGRDKYWEIDHIHPLSKGGSFHYTNTQPLSITENRKKSNRL
jgi:hypothetical protein